MSTNFGAMSKTTISSRITPANIRTGLNQRDERNDSKVIFLCMGFPSSISNRKKEYGTNGNNGTDGKGIVYTSFFPFVPLFPFVPYSLVFFIIVIAPKGHVQLF